MDEMKLVLTSKLMKGLFTKIVKKLISSKLGVKVDVDLTEVRITCKDGKVHLHANVDGEMKQEDFMNLIQKHI